MIVTVDTDWASEASIEETLDFLSNYRIKPTIFITHRSPCIEAHLNDLDVALHPYFAADSSHGSTIAETVRTVMALPHNLPAFRCHRFAVCNASKQAMVEAGMRLSSNVCTDLEVVAPFRDRFGLLEVPIFFEDGGYLWRKHPLEMSPLLMEPLLRQEKKVILVHPMHISLNTPHFDYMFQVKKSLSRNEWNQMTKKTMEKLQWKGRGIKDLLNELFQGLRHSSSLRELLT